MSKAFTKESEQHDEDSSSEVDSALQSLKGRKNYMTQACFERLRSELKTLLNVTRPEMTQTVAWAASNGDRSENADYQYGKRRLREIDRRIRFLTKRLEIAEVIDPRTIQSNKVQFGASVTLEYESGETKTFQIVGIDESEPSQNKISWISPLAQALLNRTQGETIEFKLKDQEIRILKINYS